MILGIVPSVILNCPAQSRLVSQLLRQFPFVQVVPCTPSLVITPENYGQ